MIKKNPLRTGLDWVYKIFFVIQSVCMYASVLTVVATVLLREVFKISLVWGYEIACWFVIILVFLGMPRNLRYKTNIGVSFVYDISPKAVQTIFSIIHFVVEVTVLVMKTSGFKIWITRVGKATLPASRFTNTMYYGVVGIGVAFSLLEMFTEIIDLFVKKEEKEAIREKTIEEELIEEAKKEAGIV